MSIKGAIISIIGSEGRIAAAISYGIDGSKTSEAASTLRKYLAKQAATISRLREELERLQRQAGSALLEQESKNREIALKLRHVYSEELMGLAIETRPLKEFGKSGLHLVGRPAKLGRKIAVLATDLHGLSQQLHPAVLEDLGLVAAIRSECYSFRKNNGIQIDFIARRVPDCLPPDTALCLFRIAQENLRCIQQFADAGRVRVSLSGSTAGITLRVDDDDANIHPEEGRERGPAWIGIEERLRRLGGVIKSDRQGKGTRVSAFIPLARTRRMSERAMQNTSG